MSARPLNVVLIGGTGFIGQHVAARLPDWAARLQARLFEQLPGDPVVSRDNLDSMLVDNVVAAGTHALTAEALGIKLTAIESVAPHYLNRHGRLDHYRTHAGR